MFVRQSHFDMCNNRCGNFRYIGVIIIVIVVDLYHVHSTLYCIALAARASIIRARSTCKT